MEKVLDYRQGDTTGLFDSAFQSESKRVVRLVFTTDEWKILAERKEFNDAFEQTRSLDAATLTIGLGLDIIQGYR